MDPFSGGELSAPNPQNLDNWGTAALCHQPPVGSLGFDSFCLDVRLDHRSDRNPAADVAIVVEQ